MLNKTLWSEQFKIRLSKSDESMDLHDIIKILIVRKTIRKYVNKKWLRIYTEFELDGGKLIPDIYVEDIKKKSIICYEIQKNLGKNYVAKKTEQYNKLISPYFFNTIDLIIIPIKDAPNDLTELNSWLNQFIF